MNENKLREMLHWDGEIVHGAEYVRYRIPPKVA